MDPMCQQRVITCPIPMMLTLTPWLGQHPSDISTICLRIFPLSCRGVAVGSWTARLTPASPGVLWRARPGLCSDQNGALVCGGGEAGQADRVSGQTWESTHGPFSKAGAVPGAPAGSSGPFHWAHPSLAWPMVEMQI